MAHDLKSPAGGGHCGGTLLALAAFAARASVITAEAGAVAPSRRGGLQLPPSNPLLPLGPVAAEAGAVAPFTRGGRSLPSKRRCGRSPPSKRRSWRSPPRGAGLGHRCGSWAVVVKAALRAVTASKRRSSALAHLRGAGLGHRSGTGAVVRAALRCGSPPSSRRPLALATFAAWASSSLRKPAVAPLHRVEAGHCPQSGAAGGHRPRTGALGARHLRGARASVVAAEARPVAPSRRGWRKGCGGPGGHRRRWV